MKFVYEAVYDRIKDEVHAAHARGLNVVKVVLTPSEGEQLEAEGFAGDCIRFPVLPDVTDYRPGVFYVQNPGLSTINVEIRIQGGA